MNKLISIGLVSSLFFVGSLAAQTSDDELVFEDDKIFQRCEDEASKLNLEGDALEIHIDDCIYANSETIEESDENEEPESTLEE